MATEPQRQANVLPWMQDVWQGGTLNERAIVLGSHFFENFLQMADVDIRRRQQRVEQMQAEFLILSSIDRHRAMVFKEALAAGQALFSSKKWTDAPREEKAEMLEEFIQHTEIPSEEEGRLRYLLRQSSDEMWAAHVGTVRLNTSKIIRAFQEDEALARGVYQAFEDLHQGADSGAVRQRIETLVESYALQEGIDIRRHHVPLIAREVSSSLLHQGAQGRAIAPDTGYFQTQEFTGLMEFMERVEGNNKVATVPADQHGIPFGNSGVTIGMGIDLGQRSEDSLRDLTGDDRDLFNKLVPFVGLQQGAAQQALKEHGQLEITDDQAANLSRGAIKEFTNKLAAEYPKFRSLPEEAKTVLVSLAYQHGNIGGWSDMTPARVLIQETAQRLFEHDWQGAVAALEKLADTKYQDQAESTYRNRRMQEADLIRRLFDPDMYAKQEEQEA